MRKTICVNCQLWLVPNTHREIWVGAEGWEDGGNGGKRLGERGIGRRESEGREEDREKGE